MSEPTEVHTESPQPEFLSEEFFQRYAYAMINTDPGAGEDYANHFTLGNYRRGLPELYMRHPMPEICNPAIAAVVTMWGEEEVKAGIVTFDNLTSLTGEMVRFELVKLSGADLLTVVDDMQSYFQRFTNKEVIELYEFGVYQLVLPNQHNVLPSEQKSNLIDGQKIQAVSIH